MSTRLAQEIRLARKRLRMNQAEFAQALEASQGSISKWESGREVPRFETLQRLSELSPEFADALKPAPTRIRSFERYIMDKVAKVLIRGYCLEAGSLSAYEQPLECSILVSPEWEHTVFDGYLIEARTRQTARYEGGTNLVVVAPFSEDDRIDDVPFAVTYLCSVKKEDKNILFLANPIAMVGGPLSLWPSSYFSQRRTMPILVDGSGKIASPDHAVLGVVVCTMTYESRILPTDLEPRQF